VLAACGTAPSQGSWDDETYYTTEGAIPLSWQLDVYTPDGATQRASYTQASPGGIVEGFQWSVRGDGAPLQMRWQAVPSGVDIQPRDIVQLTVDGEPAFWGVVTRTWPDDETDVREYVALGGLELLRYRSHDGMESYYDQDVAAIARQIISAYKHPAVTYDAALIPDLGDTVALPIVHRQEVGQLLDVLARSVSSKRVSWGVDAQGRAFFGVPQGSVQVGYETSDLHWQPEAGDEVVTRVDLVLATQNTPSPDGIRYYPCCIATPECPGPFHYPAPIIVSGWANEDSIYGVQRAYSASQFLVRKSDPLPTVLSYSNLNNASNAVDGSAASYASNAGSGDSELVLRLEGYPRGVAIGYSLYNSELVLEVELEYSWDSDSYPTGSTCRYHATYLYRLAPCDAGNVNIIALPPIDRHKKYDLLYDVQVTLRVRGLTAADEWRVYEAAVIGIDYGAAMQYIDSLLRLPTQRPASIRWPRYQAPVAEATITGAPGGDLTHQVREWRYLWTPQQLETVAMLGDVADDDMTRAISRAVLLNQSAALATTRALTEAK